jgi:hypothetical protein
MLNNKITFTFDETKGRLLIELASDIASYFDANQKLFGSQISLTIQSPSLYTQLIKIHLMRGITTNNPTIYPYIKNKNYSIPSMTSTYNSTINYKYLDEDDK